MSGFNGSGTFNISGVGLPYTSGTVISSSVANQLNTDLATGLSNCITKDGQQILTANIPFNNYKITGLGIGTAGTDSASVYNIQCSTGTFLTVSGTDTIVGVASPAITSGYVTGMTYRFIAAGTNTGAVTLNISSQGAKAITKNGTVALAAGDIPSGVLVSVTYDGTQFVLQNQTTFASLTTANITITNNATVGGTLGVTGATTLAGKTVLSGGNTLTNGNTLTGTLATVGQTNNGVAFLKNQTAVSTTLSAGISATDLSIPLTSVTGFPTGGGTVLIDNEQITYASIAGNSLTVSSTANRGVNGTAAAAHSISAAVSSATFGSTTLSAGIDNSVLTIPVVSTANFPDAGTLIIDAEQISYTGKTGTSFTGATRGVNGTTSASHLSAASVVGVQLVSTSSNLKYDDVTGALKVPNLSVTNLSISGASNITNAQTFSQKIQPLSASTSGSALTITLSPTVLDFRGSTASGTNLTTGVSTVQITSPITLTVPSTATLGSVSSYAFRLVVLAINNAGTAELAVVNISGGNQLDETNTISTTTISASANSISTIYSTTGRTNVLYRVVGFIDFPAGTAGTWATINEVQGIGGQALASLSSLGYGQTWQDVKTSPGRVAGTTYYNTTGKPIMVSIKGDLGDTVSIYSNSSGTPTTIIASGDGYNSGGTGSRAGVTAIIPPNWAYKSSSMTVVLWMELR